MALNRKYAALPDLDSAPDVYETPELTDDNSTVPTTAARTHSDDEFGGDDDDTEAISRSRLRIDEARSRFLPANVDANKADFSDRVDGKRKSYKASSRRQRILENGTEELGDLSDDDDQESLDRKIARLKREVEEAREAHARRQAVQESSASAGGTSTTDLSTLSQLLDDITQSSSAAASSGAGNTGQLLGQSEDTDKAGGIPSDGSATYTVTYSPAYEQSHALAKAASFDGRLMTLEKGLGIGSSSGVEGDETGLPRAVLPTLDLLEKHVSTLAQASTSSLDAISRRVRTLASEQDRLNNSREKAKSLREELGKQAPDAEPEGSEQESKINALYGTLPTIESLSPMLPSLLDRLRSLRAIHADAATASQTLERIEQQQIEVTGELKQWREGLEKMGSVVKEGDTAVQGNMEVMDSWVKNLEGRMAKLAE